MLKIPSQQVFYSADGGDGNMQSITRFRFRYSMAIHEGIGKRHSRSLGIRDGDPADQIEPFDCR